MPSTQENAPKPSGRLFFSLVSACFLQDGSQMRKSMSIRKKVGKRIVTDQSM